MVDVQVTKAQGQELLNLRHLKQIVEQSVVNGDRSLVLGLEQPRMIGLDIERAVAGHWELLKRHRIPADRSADLENGSAHVLPGPRPAVGSSAANQT